MSKLKTVIVCSMLFASCGIPPQTKKVISAAEQAPKPEKLRFKQPLSEEERAAVEEKVRYVLKDPDSAKFRNIYASDIENDKSKRTVCGEVNAKNSYGGYVGFKPFYMNKDEPKFWEDDKEQGWSLTNFIIQEICLAAKERR